MVNAAICFGPPWDSTPAQDTHVLRGQRTGPLRTRLRVVDASAGAWRKLKAYSDRRAGLFDHACWVALQAEAEQVVDRI